MSLISEKLDHVLVQYRNRLKKVLILRGTAILVFVALLLSVITAFLSIRTGFSSDTVNTGRIVLLIAISAIVFFYFVRPLNLLGKNLSGLIERRSDQFKGRIETYSGLKTGHPLKDLLAEDTLVVTSNNAPETIIQKRELTIPGVITGICILVFLWLIIAGPGLLNYGVRHLWGGWAFSNLLPPQTISVTPGDEAVRRGGSVRLLAEMNGFNPSSASIQVKMGDKDWQEVDMIQTDRGFEFTFFSIREETEYYVTSAGIRSPDYQIQVVDLPDIDNLKLTYHYPEWAKRTSDIKDPGGDIQTIAGTSVELEVLTDAPLPSGVLVLNGESQDLDIIERTATGTFEILEDGQYYIAAELGGELVRLSEDYFIRVMEDGKPEIKINRPGRDWTASSIEEVTVEIEASDDYALETMELRYSVNGGEWQSVPMEIEGRKISEDHVFYLEDMQARSGRDNTATLEDLQAGDLVAYYARTSDRDQESSTDMYFIQVQPFDRRYTQSQQTGGAGGQGGNEQQEISQRQKEIIVSTWNLIREKTESKGEISSTTQDNAMLLSGLQSTLSEQARTLAERARARQLNEDEQINKFVENMEMAAEAMMPASDYLKAIDLESAIQPEQEALQHLLRAEAVFTDMQVAFNQGGQGGGGSSRGGQDLAEMFELEMDLKKNQYETGSPASPSAQTQQADDAMDQLEDLARRQEQLANNLHQQNNLTEAQRWQQEMLRREAEELQQRLEQMEQMAQNSQQGQQGQEGQQGQQSSSSQAGSEQQQSAANGQQGGQGNSQSATSRRLESAIRAMDEISQAMQNQGDREALDRAAQEASRQLQGARDEVARTQQRSMQESFDNMAASANELYEEQMQMEQELQQAVRRALAERDRTGQVTSGLSPAQEAELAEEKKAMSERLQRLEQAIYSSVEQYEDSMPEAIADLREAQEVIGKSQLQERLYVASEYIAYGAAPYIAGSESAVTQALSDITDMLQDANRVANGTELADTDELGETLAQTRSLRRDLEQLNRDGEPSESSNQASDPSQNPSQSSSQGGESPGQNIAQGNVYGGGVWQGNTNREGPVIDRATWDRFGQELNEAARAIRDVIPELRDQDLSLEEINEIRDLTQQLQQQIAFSGNGKNDEIIEQEYLAALNLIEQLELRLDAGMKNKDPQNVRSAAAEPISTEYKDAIAEYYRRLSREE